ncbi:hypothetical protein DL93DRAFT_2036471, partial [Clavulina sp. PMI_390]
SLEASRRGPELKNLASPPPQGASTAGTDSPKFPRRQSLTLQESAIFNELFEKIFANAPKRAPSTTKGRDPLSNTGIGMSPRESRGSVDDLFGKLRKRSKRYHDPTEYHLHLEQQRAIMENCRTDRELLDWALVNVFSSNDSDAFPSKSSLYPHLLATLISLFRDKFRDPHTALSIFAAARHLSVPSYVFGCTTAVYNELLATRWTAFRDLEGVVEALSEMRTNGVFPDAQTRRILMQVKREAMT